MKLKHLQIDLSYNNLGYNSKIILNIAESISKFRFSNLTNLNLNLQYNGFGTSDQNI